MSASLLNQRDLRAPAAAQAIAQARDELQAARPSPDDHHLMQPPAFFGDCSLTRFWFTHLTVARS
jgi:hypothetical protein